MICYEDMPTFRIIVSGALKKALVKRAGDASGQQTLSLSKVGLCLSWIYVRTPSILFETLIETLI